MTLAVKVYSSRVVARAEFEETPQIKITIWKKLRRILHNEALRKPVLSEVKATSVGCSEQHNVWNMYDIIIIALIFCLFNLWIKFLKWKNRWNWIFLIVNNNNFAKFELNTWNIVNKYEYKYKCITYFFDWKCLFWLVWLQTPFRLE